MLSPATPKVFAIRNVLRGPLTVEWARDGNLEVGVSAPFTPCFAALLTMSLPFCLPGVLAEYCGNALRRMTGRGNFHLNMAPAQYCRAPAAIAEIVNIPRWKRCIAARRGGGGKGSQ